MYITYDGDWEEWQQCCFFFFSNNNHSETSRLNICKCFAFFNLRETQGMGRICYYDNPDKLLTINTVYHKQAL